MVTWSIPKGLAHQPTRPVRRLLGRRIFASGLLDDLLLHLAGDPAGSAGPGSVTLDSIESLRFVAPHPETRRVPGDTHGGSDAATRYSPGSGQDNLGTLHLPPRQRPRPDPRLENPSITQIDHILVSPSAGFLIETKEMNGWVFGSPGQKHWAQSFAAGRRSRKVGIRSKQFKFYNPLLQNEGHAKALVNLGIVDRWRIRPIVVFVGDAQLKTAGKFLPFDEHEKMASKNSTWRMRGVICMSLANLHRYIAFSVNAPSNPGLTLQKMEMICAKIRAAEIPMTAESHAKHVDFVQSVKEMESR